LVLDEPETDDVAVQVDNVKIYVPNNLEGIVEISTLDYWPLDGFSFERTDGAGC
jgi:hypothetical protein